MNGIPTKRLPSTRGVTVARHDTTVGGNVDGLALKNATRKVS
jgi:hypothetical protein